MGLHKSRGRPRKKQDQAAYIARLEMENAPLKNSTGSYANSQNRSPLLSDLLSSRERCGAGMENFFGQLKEEAIYQTKLLIFQQAQEVIDDYI